MGSRILHVMYQHQCDWCSKKKRSKKPIPDGWFKTQNKIFCKEDCMKQDAVNEEHFSLLQKQKIEEPRDIQTLPSGRKGPKQYGR